MQGESRDCVSYVLNMSGRKRISASRRGAPQGRFVDPISTGEFAGPRRA